MAYAPLVIAGVSALSNYIGSRGARAAAQTQTNRLKLRASPEHLMDVIRKLQPFYRELVASGLGPQFLQESARQISMAGLTGTGVGEALRTVAGTVPQAAATGMASEAAQGVVQNELASVGGMTAGGGNPLADALAAGARAYIGTSEAMRARNQAQREALVNAPREPLPTQPFNPPPITTGPGVPEPGLFPRTS